MFQIKRTNIQFLESLRYLRGYFVAIMIATASLTVLMFGLLRRKSRFPSAIVFSMTEDQVFRKNSFKSFLEAITEERFRPYFDTNQVLIQVRSFRTLILGNKHYTIDSSIYLATKCLKRKYYPLLMKKILKSLIFSRRQKEFQIRELKMLIFDLPLLEIVNSFSKVRIDLVTTNSSLKTLPLTFMTKWSANRIMLWYSSNSKPISYKGKSLPLGWDTQYIKNHIDIHLVWNNYDVAFLNSHGIHNAWSIGPIPLQPRLVAETNSRVYTVTFFDVTPFSNEVRSRLGEYGDFYSENQALMDLEIILDLSRYLSSIFEDRFEMRIKPKRRFSSLHSRVYVNRVLQSEKAKEIQLIDPDVNLYEAIGESDLIIGTPWTSPVSLAQEISTNCLYFSTHGQDWSLPEQYEGVRVFRSSSQLYEYLWREVEGKLVKSKTA